MTDRTQPLPAPAGYKWHIRDSGHLGVFYLQVWKVGTEIPEDVLRQMTGCEVEVYFEKESQIRRTSKAVMRALDQKLADEERARRILALNGRLK